ncbi:argininosuccinate lyase [Oceanicola sp. 22II-s10i]|uniref:argininosuccinate lyase n=1 Tax=Oceanicola sp. 22II-s10i TaxID=1317116 RepID=UPI000B527049|nr:argininosuccinate lyase [Oceanicola sp. 22II-s10i]
MKTMTALITFALLAACGIDGEPVPPSRNQPAPAQDGVTFSGYATVGITKSW